MECSDLHKGVHTMTEAFADDSARDSVCETNTLMQQLKVLREQGANRYDPVRFCFVESLVRRAANQQNNVCQLLESKARMAIDDYQVARECARLDAEKFIKILSDTIVDNLPTGLSNNIAKLSAEAKDSYQQGCFSRVQQLARQWQRVANTKTTISLGLASLREYLSDPGAEAGTSLPADFGFSEELEQQRNRINQCATLSVDENNHLGGHHSKTASLSTRVALKSSLVYQQHQRKKRANDFINLAFNETPENPGPLNPEILTIRLLRRIWEISPEYLSRYVSYFETLQRLDKAGEL